MQTIVHLITGLEIGGAERMLAQLATRTNRDRFANVVISMTGLGKMGPALVGAGITVESLGMRRGAADPRGLIRLLKILRRRRPQLLQTWLYHADLLGLAAWRLGAAPHLVWGVHCTQSVDGTVVRRMLRRWSRLPDAVVVASGAGQRFHQELGYRPHRWVHIPNGFDTGELRPDDSARGTLRRALGIENGAFAIALPARYHPMKDHANFLAAAAALAQRRPEALFLMIGAGSERDNRELAAAIAVHGLAGRVRLLGERPDLASLYPGFDLVTLSSAFGESFPMVLGEAMSCGVPCVATDVGDSAEIIGRTGLVVPPRDPAALAAAWERVAALGAEKRRVLGLQARERIVRNYDLGAIVGRYEALYDEICMGPGEPRAEA